MFLIRLYRLLPLILIFGIIALIIYLVMQIRYSRDRAKDVVLRFLIAFSLVGGGFFLLATLYAALERNVFVVEFFGSCVLFFLIVLGIASLCRGVFLKHHPAYKKKVMKTKFLGKSKKK